MTDKDRQQLVQAASAIAGGLVSRLDRAHPMSVVDRAWVISTSVKLAQDIVGAVEALP